MITKAGTCGETPRKKAFGILAETESEKFNSQRCRFEPLYQGEDNGLRITRNFDATYFRFNKSYENAEKILSFPQLIFQNWHWFLMTRTRKIQILRKLNQNFKELQT